MNIKADNLVIGKNTFIDPTAKIVGLSGNAKNIQIGDNVFIGAGAIIKDSIKICDNVVIGMGSLVLKNIDTPGVYVGNPLKKINI